jgi:hypothetical protein
MTAAEELRAALLAYAPLVALVGQRIRSDLAKEGDTPPVVIFRRFAIAKEYGLDNTVLATRETFQIECWGETRDKSSDVAELVIDALAAADLPIEESDPDSLDPNTALRAVVLNVDIWS